MTRSIERALRGAAVAAVRVRPAILVAFATAVLSLADPVPRARGADPRADGEEGVPKGLNRPPVAPRPARPSRPGDPASTEVFGVKGSGLRIVYLVDGSASMANQGGIALDAARDEVAESLGHLHRGVEFSVLFYADDRVNGPAGRALVPFSADAVRRAKKGLEDLEPQGHARHLVAIDEALRLKPDLVFLITDAHPRDDLRADDIQKILRIRESARIMVAHLADSDAQRCPNLAELAGKTGGRYEALSFDGDKWTAARPAPVAPSAPR